MLLLVEFDGGHSLADEHDQLDKVLVDFDLDWLAEEDVGHDSNTDLASKVSMQ